MSLLSILPQDNDNMKDEAYFRLLESHLSFLRNHPSNTIASATGQVADMFEGDFYGLLNHLRVDIKYHYITMRVNGLYCSSDYDGTQTEIVIPSRDAVNRIDIIFNSRYGE